MMKILKDHHIAEVKMSYSPNVDIQSAPMITGSEMAGRCVSHTWEDVEYIERFKVMLLNRANRVKGIITIGIMAYAVDTKVIFQAAILSNSTGITIAHNHPSGNLTPGDADKQIIITIKQACKFQDNSLSDYLIITQSGNYSFA